eukprot:Pompholyxophrys_punicea_v1_NODE_233_length_2631_cov_11.916149.p3 type:complete len:124 gc:universal NODE_233_length_2631_cov_11.916149:1801-1430(-)
MNTALTGIKLFLVLIFIQEVTHPQRVIDNVLYLNKVTLCFDSKNCMLCIILFVVMRCNKVSYKGFRINILFRTIWLGAYQSGTNCNFHFVCRIFFARCFANKQFLSRWTHCQNHFLAKEFIIG